MRTLGEAIRVTSKAYYKILDMIEEDDGSNPERTKRLQRAREILDGSLDGLESVREYDY